MNLFQRVLVPLDGSLRAERALPLAARIARASRGNLILLRVVEAMPGKNADVPPATALESERMRAQFDEAQQYLNALAHAREFADIPLTIAVHAGPVIPTILATAQSAQANLLVLCGPQGSQEPALSLDSMVEQCLEQTSIPLLLVPAHGDVLRRQDHPFALLLAFDQAQPEHSLLESTITLLTALAVREHDQPPGNVVCTLRAFPSFSALNPPDKQKDTPSDRRTHPQWHFTVASPTGKRHEGGSETSEGKCEGDLLVLGMPAQPERVQWMHDQRNNAALVACGLPLLFIPLPTMSQVGATR